VAEKQTTANAGEHLMIEAKEDTKQKVLEELNALAEATNSLLMPPHWKSCDKILNPRHCGIEPAG